MVKLRSIFKSKGKGTWVSKEAGPLPKVPHPRQGGPLLWEHGQSEFVFLRSETSPSPRALGIHGDYMTTFAPNAMVFIARTKVVVYNIARKTVQEIVYETEVADLNRVLHILSPNGTLLLQFLRGAGSSGNYYPLLRKGSHASIVYSQILKYSCAAWDVSVIDLKTKHVLAHLGINPKLSPNDLWGARWSDDSEVVIPVAAHKRFIRWVITKGSTVVQPLSVVTDHERLRLCSAQDKNWWVAWGKSEGPGGQWTGTAEIHDVRRDESRVVPCLACCLSEAEVYDLKKTLIIIVGADPSGQLLSLSVQQLDPDIPGEAFQSVITSVDTLKPPDFPSRVTVLEPLPIVAVSTRKNCLYFFELHTGCYLYSQDMSLTDLIFLNTSLGSGMMVCNQKDAGVFKFLSVNEGDLIGYVRQVIKDDTLASGISIRTGLSGADDVVIDDMYRQYRGIE